MIEYKKHLKYLLFSWFLINGCSEPNEACLDLNSTNFDVTADIACGSCCTYPDLTLTFLHQFIPSSNPDTVFNFRYLENYESPQNLNSFFNVERIRFFVSNVKLINDEGVSVGSSDTIQLESNIGDFTVEDNFAKVDRDIFSANTIQNFIAPGIYSKIEFDIGLQPQILEIDPESVPDNHTLDVSSDSLIYDSSGYLSNLVIFNRDTIPGLDSTIIRISDVVEFSQTVINPFEKLEIIEGVNINLRIQIDYNKWFENINIKDDSEAEIASQISENLPNAFKIVEIILE